MGLFGDLGKSLGFGDDARLDWVDETPDERKAREQLYADTFGYANTVRGLLDPKFNYYEGQDPFEADFSLSGADKETGGLLRERLDSILRGDRTVEDEALEQDIEREYKKLENELSAQMGPNWRMSTAGVQSLRAFNEWSQRSRSENRLGQKGQDEAFASTLGSMISDAGQRALAQQGLLLDAHRSNAELGMAGNQLNNATAMSLLGARQSGLGALTGLHNVGVQRQDRKLGQRAFNTGIDQANQSGALGLLGTAGGLLLGGPIGQRMGSMVGGVLQGGTGSGGRTTTLQSGRWSPRNSRVL